MLSEDRRREIATFLRTRRSRRQPEEVGLPRAGRRRTPGLRRGEVAALAGVSTEWYTWLEQARDVTPSVQTLQSIAAALQLEPGETQHLLTLCGHAMNGDTNGGPRPASITQRLQRLLDRLDHCPAWVIGERWDILGWNQGATVIFGDLAAMEGIERNALYQSFLNPRMRRTLVDWELHARDCVAKIRAKHAHNVDDPWYNEVIELLRAQSPEFATWWNEHNVQLPSGGVKRYEHEEAGLLTFEYTMVEVAGEPLGPVQLVTYVPVAETDTEQKLRALLQAVSVTA